MRPFQTVFVNLAAKVPILVISNSFWMDSKKTVDYIVDWLGSYANKAGLKGFVVGISGGIDSALTSTLCAKTGLEVLCLEMPIHQAENQVTRAASHIEWLQSNFSKINRQKIDLTETFDTLVRAFPAVANEEDRFLPLANTRARLRMSTLYYFAGLHGYLVAGTGNKVEDFGGGFFTKYGDGGVDLSPIADLVKSEVYTLAAYLGINQEILEAAPTDGLFGDDRTDADQLGASYPELEWAMEQDALGKKPLDFAGREAEVLTIYQRLNRINQHKMLPIPVCNIPDKVR
jgi:NAD+ synthase